MRPPAALSGVAISAIDLANLCQPSGFQANACPNRITIGFSCASQLEFNPVSRRAGRVVIEEQRLVSICLDDIQTAIIIKIANANPAPVKIVIYPGFRGDIFKAAVGSVMKKFLLLVAAP